MKRFLYLTLTLSISALHAQSFEWNKPATPAHPKEVQLSAEEQAERGADPQKGTAGVYAPDADGSKTAYGEVYRASELTGSHPALPLGTLLRVTNVDNGRSVVVRITDRGRECADCLITLSEKAAEKLGMSETATVTFARDGFSNWNPAPGDLVIPPAAEPAASPAVVAAPPHPVVAPAPVTEPEPDVFTREVVLADLDERSGDLQEVPRVEPPAPTVSGTAQARGVEASPATESVEFAVQLAAYSNESYALRRVEELKGQGLSNVFYRTQQKDDGEVINRVYAGPYPSMSDAQSAVKEIEGRYQIAGIVAKPAASR